MSYGAAMKRIARVSALLVWVGLVTWASAEVRLPADSPFQVILDRNPFGLRPPPTNVVALQTSAPPAQVNVNLSGITFARGVKRAWMVIPAGGPRTNTTCFSMGEGDPEFEGVRVEQIDVERGVVQIVKNGIPTTLDFQNHGLTYSGPVAAAVPGRGRPGQLPVPGQRRAGVPVPDPGVRPVLPGRGSSTSVNLPGGGVTGLADNSPQVIPARAIRTTQQQPAEPVDPVVQAIQMQAQQLRARQQGMPFPPLPPIPGMNPTPSEGQE